MAIQVEIVEKPIDARMLVSRVGDDACGAVNVFLGVTRNHHGGRAVKGLEYHCYQEMALKELGRVAKGVAARHGVDHFYVVHRVGRVEIGELSLGVAAASAHRAQSLDVTRDFVDQLKKDVPIWKREYFEDGSVGWVEGAEIKPV